MLQILRKLPLFSLLLCKMYNHYHHYHHYQLHVHNNCLVIIRMLLYQDMFINIRHICAFQENLKKCFLWITSVSLNFSHWYFWHRRKKQQFLLFSNLCQIPSKSLFPEKFELEVFRCGYCMDIILLSWQQYTIGKVQLKKYHLFFFYIS